MDDRVQFEDCGVDAVEDEGGGGGADAETYKQSFLLSVCCGWSRRGVDEEDGFELCEDGVDGFGDEAGGLRGGTGWEV